MEDRTLLAAAIDPSWQRIEPLGSLMFDRDYEGDLAEVYSNDFESGSLGAEWTTSSSTPNGRVGVTDVLGTPAHSGDYHLSMDTAVVGPNNLNEAILTLDLSGRTGVELSFWHKDVNDEDTGLPASFVGSFVGDGVSISEDGITWHTLTSLNNSNSPNLAYTHFTFDLDQAAAIAQISFDSDFHIKFQQYDNFPFNTDGRTFDDILVTSQVPAPDLTTAFLEGGQTLTVVATPQDPSATLTATVRDPGGVLIASATASAPGETVDIQTAGILNDGNYTVEITGDVATAYNMSLFRNATVEVIDSADGAEQDASGSFVQLGSGRWGIVGTFEPQQSVSSIGLLGANGSDTAIVFDPATNTVVGSVAVGPGIVGDTLVLDDGSLGFITDFQGRLWVIDMATATLATGPISISNPGEDISITPDQKFLVISDGGNPNVPLSIVSTSTLTEVGTYFTGTDADSVDVGADGSILVTSVQSDNVRRLTIDSAGNITDTGEVLGVINPNNGVVAPGSDSGVVVTRNTGEIRSFTMPGLGLVDVRNLTGNFGLAAAFNATGNRLYVRSQNSSSNGAGFIDAFDYNPTTGAISATPVWTVNVDGRGTFFGIDFLDVASNGNVYVPQNNSLDVFDSNGNLVTSITHPDILGAIGVNINAAPIDDGPLAIEDFEDGNIVEYTSTATTNMFPSAAAAHDGNFGLQVQTGGGWIYRDDPSVQLTRGTKFSTWVQTTANDGRAYFGFGASAAGTYSVVVAPNTGNFIVQRNVGFGFADLGSSPQAWQANNWYRIEVDWQQDNDITATLYDSDGTTQLNQVQVNDSTFTEGGIAFRGFSSDKYFDTVQVINKSKPGSSVLPETDPLPAPEKGALGHDPRDSADDLATVVVDTQPQTGDVAPGTSNATSFHGPLVGMASTGYGSQAVGTRFLAEFTLDNPDVLNNVGSQPGFIPAGDFDNSGDFSSALAIDNSNRLLRIDTATGAVTVLGNLPLPAGVRYDGMATDPTTGTIYVASGFAGGRSYLYELDVTSVTTTLIGEITNAPGIVAIAADDQGVLFGLDLINDVLVRIDPGTGAGTVVGPIGYNANFAQGMDFDEASGTLYISAFNGSGNVGELRTVNRNTGATTLVGPLGSTTPGGTMELTWLGIAATGDNQTGTEPDTDEYLIDLTGKAGKSIDVALSLDGEGEPGELQTVTVFEQNFESGLGANETAGGIFVVNDTNPLNNGTKMMGHRGTYTSNEYSYYEVALDLTAVSGPVQLSFDYVAEIEDYFDGVNVQVSTGAISPTDPPFTAVSGFPYDSVSGSAGIGSEAFDGNGGTTAGTAVFDLSAYAGQIVNFRIQFGSDSSVTRAGFNLDNLIVTTDVLTSGVTLELLDTDGTTVLATGTDVGDNLTAGILDFIVPADGIYTIRVTGDSGRYGIAVTDDLVFDTEPNEPGAGAFSASQTQPGIVFPNVLTFDFTDVPTNPVGDAILNVTALMDLSASSESLALEAEGNFLGDLFATGGSDTSSVNTSVIIPQAVLSTLAADGTITFTLTPTQAVNFIPSGAFVTLDLSYDTASTLRSLDNVDGAVGFLSVEDASGLNLITNFDALPSNGGVPPDPIVAVGPEQIVAMVNVRLAIYDKDSEVKIFEQNLSGSSGFWGSLGSGQTIFDPWVEYDSGSDRFYAIAIDFVGGLYLAVSTDSTPTSGGDWYKYKFDRSASGTFPDYPKLGFNEDAIFITANDFSLTTDTFQFVSMVGIDKASVLSGGAANIVYDEQISGAFSVHPAEVRDAGDTMYFAEARGFFGSTGVVRIHRVNTTTYTRTTTDIVVNPYNFPGNVPQLGGPALESVGMRFMSAVVQDGSLWTAHTIQDPAVDTETVVRWYELDLASSTVVQQGNVDPGPGLHTWMPHINVDQDNDMGIAFSISGPSQYASIGYTGRLSSDPLGTTLPVETARDGEGTQSIGGRNRWGDYSGLALDPEDSQTFWLFNEFIRSNGVWDTHVAAFQVGASTSQPDVDAYTLTLGAGDTVGFRTSTPFDGDGINLLDPSIEIFDPSGNSVAFDSNSADGKNAMLSFTPAASGVYTIAVGGETDGGGEYVLSHYNINDAPVIESASFVSDTIDENDTATLIVVFSDPDPGDTHTIEVVWGDGQSSTMVVAGPGSYSFTHQYLDDGSSPGNGTPVDVYKPVVTVTDAAGDSDSVGGSQGVTTELITNGDFETGDFTGWTVGSVSSGNWAINDGTFVPPGPGAALPPISGNFDAVSFETGPGVAILSGPIVVPDSVSSAVLSWSDRIRNYANLVGQDFADPLQEWRVLITNASGSLIQEVYSTNPGDPLLQIGPNHRSFDLTSLFQSLAGETIQVRFEQQSQFYFFNVTLDDVSLQVETAPELTVNNVAPTLTCLTTDQTVINENDTITLTGAFADPGTLDVHTVDVDWGDGTTDTVVLPLGDRSFVLTHQYLDDGSSPGNGTASDLYTIVVTVSDDDTGVVSSADTTVSSSEIYTTHQVGNRLGVISRTTGAGTDIGPFGATQTFAAAFDTDGTLYTTIGGLGTGNATLASVNQTTGAVTPIGSGFGTNLISLEVADDGTMYGIGYNNRILYEIDQATGVATAIGDTGIGASMDLAFDSSGTLYATVANRIYTVDTGTGSSTLLGTVSGITSGSIMAIMFDANDVLYATAYVPDSPLYIVDLTGLSATVVGNTGFYLPHGGDILITESSPLSPTITVNNVEPEITSIAVSATEGNKAAVGEDVTLSGTFTDIGLYDRHLITIDWDDSTSSVFDVDATTDLTVGDTFTSTTGDGAELTITSVDSSTSAVSFEVVHQFTTGGIFEVGLDVEDDDTGIDAAETVAWVTGVRLKDGVLQIIGSAVDDHISVETDDLDPSLVHVHASFLPGDGTVTFNGGDIERIFAVLCEGDDHLNIAGSIRVPTLIDAGGGDDHINGGGGSDIILGGDGDDFLNGGVGNDILIGGRGIDRIVGGPGDDLEFGGIFSSLFDSSGAPVGSILDNSDDLRAIQAIWDDSSSDVEDRVEAIGLLDDFFSKLVDDEDDDQLTGAANEDWFLLFDGDVITDKNVKRDVITDLNPVP